MSTPVNSSVSVANTATQLGTGRAGRFGLLVSVPSSGQTVYVGGSNVTTANGIPLAPGTYMTIINDTNSPIGSMNWYGIVASGTQSVAVSEMS